jgi:hypothetical protein
MQKFLFSGRAIALRGSIRKPYLREFGEHAVLSTVAGLAGRSHARHERFSIDKAISYRAAESEINARFENGLYRTTVTSTIEGLDIAGGKFTADLVHCRLESVYDPKVYDFRQTSRILPTGSRFVGLRVEGEERRPELPPAFSLTKEEVDDFLYCQDDRHRGDRKYYPGIFPEPIRVPDVGTFYLAEWVWVNPEERSDQHLTMLRFALGSGLGMDGDGASAGVDGKGWPPKQGS